MKKKMKNNKNKRIIKFSASLMSLVMMCNVFFVDCINFDLCYGKEQEFQTLINNIEDNKNKLEDIKNNLNDINKQIIEIKISEHSMQKSEQHKTPLISYMENYIGRLNELSEHMQTLDKMKYISYKEAKGAIRLITGYYNDILRNIFNNFRSDISDFEEYGIQSESDNNEFISDNDNDNNDGDKDLNYKKLEEVMKTLIKQNTHNEEQKALKELKDTISSQSVIQNINTNTYNKLPTQHYNNSDPAKIHTVRTILQGVTDIDYKEALGCGSSSIGSVSSSSTATDTKLHESYFIPIIQSISSYYANKEISTNHINSKEEEEEEKEEEEEDNVISIDNSDELNDNDNDTDTINKTDKITDIANNDINSEISLSKILLQILSKHCEKSINIENFDDIISSLSKEDIENIILKLKKLKNRMKNNEAEIDDIISAFQSILISTHEINTTDNSNIANNTDTINDIDITNTNTTKNTNTTNDNLNTENILLDILFKTLSKHCGKNVNIDNFDDTMSSLSKKDIENIILELKNLKREMNNNEKEINILINAFQRCM